MKTPYITPHPEGWATHAIRLCAVIATLILMNASSHAQERVYSDTFNIEIDYMVERDGDGNILHSHMPTQAEVDAVVQMFACQGYLLHIVVDDEVPHIETMRRDPQNSSNFFGYIGPDSYGAIETVYRNHYVCYHYCVFGHAYENSQYQQTSSSGLGEILGDEFIVTLGLWSNETGTPFEKAATLAHEFGHNLGLTHTCGMDEEVTGPHTPNLPSTMSYFCQTSGVKWRYEQMDLVRPGSHYLKNIDYSHGRMCALNENALDEHRGVGCRQVDWNCNGQIDGGAVAEDLDRDSLGHWCASNGSRTTLNDCNEWSVIFDITCFFGERDLDDVEVVSCITYEEFEQFKRENPEFRQPPLEVEPCINNRMLFAIPGIGGVGGGWCDNPYLGFVQAYNAAWDGDIIYLLNGAYNTGAPSLLLTKRVLLTTPDWALITAAKKAKEE